MKSLPQGDDAIDGGVRAAQEAKAKDWGEGVRKRLTL
jgi:hypothetical protein